MSLAKKMGLWRNWVRAALLRSPASRSSASRGPAARRSAPRAAEVRSQLFECLEDRALLAVTFQLNFINDGSIGFNDATHGQARRAAAEAVATRVGTWFNHNATITVDMGNANNPGDNFLAEVPPPRPAGGSGNGFFNTTVGQKILSNGTTDANGAAVDTSMTFNWANSFGLDDSITFSQYDFQAVMAHELLHSVGFSANITEDGRSDISGQTWSKFDQFVTNSVGVPVINPTTLNVDSTVWNAIKTAGTGKVFFGGPQTKAVTGGAGLGLYAPSQFDLASSISHSDETAGDIEGTTHMMTSSFGTGRAARIPHAAELAVFRDMGFDTVGSAAEILVTHSSGNTTVSESGAGNTDTFTVRLSEKPNSDVVLDVRSLANGEFKVDLSRLTFTTNNWNTPQTITVTGVSDGANDGNVTVPLRLSVIDALSDSNYDPVADVDVQVTVNQEAVTTSTITVTSPADTENAGDGVTTLREAIVAANAAGPGTNTLIQFSSSVFNTPQTITLTTGSLFLFNSVEIRGPGADLLTISGGNNSRVFNTFLMDTNGVRISGLTVTGGKNAAADEGALLNEGTGTIQLFDVRFSGNARTAVVNQGRFLGLYNSSLTGNSGGDAGAIINDNGLIDIVNTTISGNTSATGGGGIFNYDPDGDGSARMTVINSTITGNRLTGTGASAQGGGIGEYLSGAAASTTVLINSIVAGNRRGSVGSDVANDLFATNSALNQPVNIDLTRSVNNLIGSFGFAGGLLHATNGNLVGNGSGGDRDIATVLNTTAALNGGKTFSHALFSNSPARDAGGNAILSVAFDGQPLSLDQRGQARTSGTTVDIGAFEGQANQAPTLSAIADQRFPVSTSATNIPLTVGDPDTPLGSLTLTVVSSDNTALVPLTGVTFGGSGANRTLAITPVAGQTGDANVVIRVSDGTATADRTVLVRVRGLDFGDAISLRQTLLADNGPRHLAFGATLGTRFDTEPDGLLDHQAEGDDSNGTDDEDGVRFGPLNVGTTGSVEIIVDNALLTGAFIDAWIDFDGRRMFESDEQIFKRQPVQNGTNTLTFQIPSEMRGSGFVIARVRISDNGNLSPLGYAPDGEVEDYLVPVKGTPGAGDFAKQPVEATAAQSVVPVDLDGDGDMDLLSTLTSDGDVVWYENDGSQRFTKQTIDANFPGVTDVIAVRLNGDNLPDIAAVGAGTSNKLTVYMNNGNRTFTAGTNVGGTLNGANSVAAGDLDGDGQQDLLTSAANQGVQWHRNNGDGTFTPTVISASTTAGFSRVIAVDLDGDGDQDVVATGRADGTVIWFSNNGSGTFSPGSLASGLSNPSAVQALDLDDDGDVDLVVGEAGTNAATSAIAVYLNNGSESFTRQKISGDLTSIGRIEAVFVADIDGDGDFDIAFAADGAPGAFGWYANTGAAGGVTFEANPRIVSGTETNPTAIRVVDMNQDGVLDFVTATNSANTIAVWAQGALNQAPVLDNSGNVFAVLGVGSRQSAEMRQGILVSELLARGAGGNPISDPDAGASRGIALTNIDRSLGTFQYTLVTNNPAESDWINVEQAGAISDASALLLPTTARLRYSTTRVPHHDAPSVFLALESKLDAGLTFRAWDQTTGVAGGRGDASVNGGSTAFSTATETSKVYFEARLFRHFNRTAELNVYTLEAEFNALAAANNPAFEDRSTDAWTGFTVLLSNVPELATTPLYRMYYGVQFNANGTEIDMGYRYLTTNLLEAQALENSGPADKRPQRAGAYFRELGVNNQTGILGYIYTTQQPGTQQMRQIYRTDTVQKPTRPPGTSEGGTPTSFTPQENGDHVYTTNTAFETTKTGTWRVEDPRGFVRPLGGSGLIAPATPAGATSTPIARAASSFDVSPAMDLFNTGATGPTFTAILPPGLATTSAAINVGNVSTTVDVGLIASPVPSVQSPTAIDEPIGDLVELASIVTSENNEETSATDDLFASLGTTAEDLCPW